MQLCEKIEFQGERAVSADFPVRILTSGFKGEKERVTKTRHMRLDKKWDPADTQPCKSGK